MESLPDDVWFQILQIGSKARRLNHVDLCSLAMVNSRFDQLTQDPTLWATLLSHDFPSRFYEAPSKALYRKKHKTERHFEFLFEQMRNSFKNFLSSSSFQPDHWISDRSASQRNFSQTAIQVNSRDQLDIANPTIGDYPIPNSTLLPLLSRAPVLYRDPVLSRASVLYCDPVLSRASGSSLGQAHNNYYENKLSKRFDKALRQKVIPNSKSYIPMNKPPRRSMPRKI